MHDRIPATSGMTGHLIKSFYISFSFLTDLLSA